MSNISFITTRKRVRSYDLPALLQKINLKRFDGKMSIAVNKWDALEVRFPEWEQEWDTLEFYFPSPRKLSIKHPHTQWMEYVGVVFRNELGKMTHAIMSDEGVEETWKPNPKKYPSYEAWIRLRFSLSLLASTNKLRYEEIVQDELSLAPTGMEKY